MSTGTNGRELVLRADFDAFEGETHRELGRVWTVLRALDGLPETAKALREITAKLSNQVGALNIDLRAHKTTLDAHTRALDRLQGWEESSKVTRIADLQAQLEHAREEQAEATKARVNWVMTVVVGVVTTLLGAGMMRLFWH